MSTETGQPVQASIQQALQEAFEPTHVEIVNESYKHNVPKGSESHFKVFIVSDAFEGVPLLKRHRMVNEALASQLEGPVHALSIKAKTPAQYAAGAAVQQTPSCRGGSGK